MARWSASWAGIDWVEPRRLQYVPLSDQLAVIRLVADLRRQLEAPPGALLLIDRPAKTSTYPALGSLTKLSRSGRAADHLLWRVTFMAPLEFVECPEAQFALTAEGAHAVALPAPTRCTITALSQPGEPGRRTQSALAPWVWQRAAALTATVAVAGNAMAPASLAAASAAGAGTASVGTAAYVCQHKPRLCLPAPASHGAPAAKAPQTNAAAGSGGAAVGSTSDTVVPPSAPNPKPGPQPPSSRSPQTGASTASAPPAAPAGPAASKSGGGTNAASSSPSAVQPMQTDPHTQAKHGKHHHHHHPGKIRPSGGAGLSTIAPAPPVPLPATPSSTPSDSDQDSPSSSSTYSAPSSTYSSSSGSDSVSSTVTSELSGWFGSVNQPPAFLIPIYKKAGRRFHVPWQILAAINSIETDYGRDLSTSSAGAMGWMQFMPETWSEYAISATGRHTPNPYNPADAIFTAARYLAANGARHNLRRAVFAYNHATWYVDAVLLRARLIKASTAHIHFARYGYINPFSEATGFIAGRTDMGIDADMSPGSPILAPADSKVVGITPNWYAGQPGVFLRIVRGPYAGRYYYLAEQITPVVSVGQKVKAGEPIAAYANSGTGIEMGWAADNAITLAQATTGYSEGEVTPAGQSFRVFLRRLGAKV